MASLWVDRSKPVATAFRVGLIGLSIVATLTVIVKWLDRHPFPSGIPRRIPAIDRYALQQPSSTRVLICIALILLLCVVQVTTLGRSLFVLKWWEPIVTELVICVGFALAYHQIFGIAPIGCGNTLASCTTLWPRLIQGSEWSLFAIIGLVLGVAWSLVNALSPSPQAEP